MDCSELMSFQNQVLCGEERAEVPSSISSNSHALQPLANLLHPRVWLLAQPSSMAPVNYSNRVRHSGAAGRGWTRLGAAGCGGKRFIINQIHGLRDSGRMSVTVEVKLRLEGVGSPWKLGEVVGTLMGPKTIELVNIRKKIGWVGSML